LAFHGILLLFEDRLFSNLANVFGQRDLPAQKKGGGKGMTEYRDLEKVVSRAVLFRFVEKGTEVSSLGPSRKHGRGH
jgi:hypothetical protein